jgi:hypothetical protein
LKKTGRATEMLPTLPGETWAPVIKNYIVYKCNTCGRTVRKEAVLGLPFALTDVEGGTYFGVAAAVIGLVLILVSASAQGNAGTLLTAGTICVGFGILALVTHNRTS